MKKGEWKGKKKNKRKGEGEQNKRLKRQQFINIVLNGCHIVWYIPFLLLA